MKAIGNFVFKGLEKRPGGTFKNDKGQDINYNESYLLKVDEVTDESINERKLKIPIENTTLINSLNKLKPYDHVTLECEVSLYQNSAKVVPSAIVPSKQ